MHGFSETKDGVVGTAGSTGRGVFGLSFEGTGVAGEGVKEGVKGSSPSGRGVLGDTDSGVAVEGLSNTGAALHVGSLAGNLIEGEGSVDSQIVFRVANNGDVFVQGAMQHSDARFKTDVAPVTQVLERLERIRTVSFRRTGVSEPPDALPRRRIGVLGQEVQAAFPELVADWGTGDQIAVDYAGLTAVLLRAIRELQAENAMMQARLAVVEQLVLREERR